MTTRSAASAGVIASGKRDGDVAPLRVEITSFGAWMVGVGAIIGSMAWLMHGPMLARAGTLACVAAWIVAAIATLPLALILMELSSMFPQAGGPYIYKYYALKRLVPGKGELLGFLTGWLFWVSIMTGLACMANGLVNLAASIAYGGSAAAPLWFGPLIIVVLFGVTTALNQVRIGRASLINNFFTFMKFAMALAFAALVVMSGKASPERLMTLASPGGSSDFLANVASVLMLSMAGFSFIEMSGCTSAETADARRVVPRAMLLTLATVTAIYVGMCLLVSASTGFSLSADGSTLVVTGTKIQATCPEVAGFIAGPIWGGIFTAGVIASIVGCSFVALLGMTRVSYSMAGTRLFPERFARLDDSGVPSYALWFQFATLCLIAIGANLACRTGLFADAYIFLGETFGFMYAFVAMLYGVCVVSLRYTDPGMERTFRVGRQGNLAVWLAASVTVLVWGFTAFFCVHWTHQLTGLVLLLAGMPIYHHYRS